MGQFLAVILGGFLSLVSDSGFAQESNSSFTERQIVARKISGQIFCTEKKNKKPMRGVSVVLLDYDKTIATAKTDGTGKYLLDVKVKEGERYELKVTSNCGDANKDLLIEEGQESNTMNFNFAKE